MIDFDAFYDAHAPAVYRFALYLSSNVAAAQDLTAEAFTRLWTARDVRVATVRAYLFTIVRNLYRRELRSPIQEVPLDASIADHRRDPEAEATVRDQLDWVLRRLQELPELDRAALLMRVQHDLPYEEIAAALGLSVAASRVRVHRARLRLSQLRAEEEQWK